MLTVSAVLLAAASGLVLTALAATVFGQVRIVANAAERSIRLLRRHDPTPPVVAAVAGLLFVAAAAALVTVVVRRVSALLAASRTARLLPGARCCARPPRPSPTPSNDGPTSTRPASSATGP